MQVQLLGSAEYFALGQVFGLVTPVDATRPWAGVLAGDFNGDGRPDLLWVNTQAPSHLWRRFDPRRLDVMARAGWRWAPLRANSRTLAPIISAPPAPCGPDAFLVYGVGYSMLRASDPQTQQILLPAVQSMGMWMRPQ